jgi:putative hydrolase of the HAD superfamily
LPTNTQNIFQILKKKKIKHIVFDLGGVIVTLDPHLTALKFSELSGKDINEILQYPTKHPIFNQYEKGEVDSASFRKEVCEILEVQADDATIDDCWNAMIIDIPKERLEWLKMLSETHQVSILSNTNEIHISYVDQLLQGHGHYSFHPLVDIVYYSHKINMRKPDANIYQHVLDNSSYLPEETLFLDDNLENINAAVTLGIKAIHVLDANEIPTLLENNGVKK